MGARSRYLIPGLIALAASAAIVVSGRLDLAPEIVLPLVTILGTGSLVAILGPARGAIVVLLLMAALNRYTAEIASVSLRPEHLAVPLVGLVLFPQLKRLIANLRLVDYLLLAWLGWSVVGGLLNAPDPPDSTRLWVMLLLAAFPYFVIVTTARTAGRIFTTIYAWMFIGIAVGIFGIATHLLYAWDINLGIQLNPVTADPTVPSTFREANLFGSAMMILTLTALSLVVFGYRRQRVPIAAAVIGFVGLQLSFTRTAWVAFVAGILILAGILLIMSIRNAYLVKTETLQPIGVMAAAALVLTAIVWLPVGDDNVRQERDEIVSEMATQREEAFATMTAGEQEVPATLPPLMAGTPTVFAVPTPSAENPDIVGRVGSITDTSDSSLRIRIEFAEQALRDWRDHPIAGKGIGSFGQTYTTTSQDRAWLSNTFVRTLHDGGIIGLALFLTPIAMLAVAGVRLTDRLTGDLDRLALSLGVAVAGMFVAFQATEGFQLAWYWAILGLYAAAVRLAHERRARLT